MIRAAGWKLLGLPAIYKAFGRLTGGDAFRDFVLKEWFELKPGESVLDIGCGPADWLSIFPEVDYTGFDFNPKYIEDARARFGARGRFLVANADDDFGDRLGRFDLVIATGVLHHLSDAEARKVIDLAARVLKPGGRFVTLDGVLCAGQSRLARRIVLSDRGRFMRPDDEYLALLGEAFDRVEHEVYHRKLRIPYTHILARCMAPRKPRPNT